MTTTAETAKAIRTTLKTNYPAVTFKVTSRQFAGGDDVTVSWTDGPTTEVINHLIADFQGGNFNPMDDLYTFKNPTPNHPTAKYILTSRHFSPAAYAAKRAEIIKKYELPEDANDETIFPVNKRVDGCFFFGQAVTHELHQMDLSNKGE